MFIKIINFDEFGCIVREREFFFFFLIGQQHRKIRKCHNESSNFLAGFGMLGYYLSIRTATPHRNKGSVSGISLTFTTARQFGLIHDTFLALFSTLLLVESQQILPQEF